MAEPWDAEVMANLHFIVKAVNSHDALVTALTCAFSLIQEYRRAFDDYGLFLGDDNKRVDKQITDALVEAGQ